VATRGLTQASAALVLLACASRPPESLGLHASALSPCPSSPNCVSSDASDPSHRVAPFELALPASEAWHAARSAVAALPRTVVLTQTPDYLHAESSSALFGFVDDLELHLRSSENLIAVRSASRLGYGDLGVNRARVEKLRALLIQADVVS